MGCSPIMINNYGLVSSGWKYNMFQHNSRGAVSFSSTCFPGQGIVLNTTYCLFSGIQKKQRKQRVGCGRGLWQQHKEESASPLQCPQGQTEPDQSSERG